ncbi:YagK/YfjJ domain-containing protein [Desulfobacter curvatus]|uniref:YagK/YfjJ domain-containing protein n=1 Tax=Desulfobacter curvatus TaxID=2290 RepID=UPI0012FC9055|nr:inovirus-type Gp2 protein [Desulfobacter curvatus]
MSITYDSTYKDSPILTNEQKQQGCHTHILNKTHTMLENAISKHNKVFCTKFDLKYPLGYQPPQGNQHISKFMSSFNKNLKRQKLDPHSIWVRERTSNDRHHYHVAVICDGNKIQSPYKINKLATEHWQRTIGSDNEGLVTYSSKDEQGNPLPCSHKIRRNSEDFKQSFDDCFRHLSYLSKDRTKGYAPYRTREYGCSRLPK